MEFVYGTGLLVASIFLLAFAKFAITRYETSAWISRFAGTETMALVITTVAAFGVAFVVDGIASHDFAVIMAEAAASLGVIALAIVGAVWAFRRKPAVTVASAKRPATV